MTSARELLAAHGLAPKKSFGQNFLHDPSIAERIAAACVGAALDQSGREPGTVLEIGAGLGALTERLLRRSEHVVAVERDRDLVPILAERFAPAIDEGRMTLVEADAVRLDWLETLAAAPKPWAVVGNLPYQITGRLVQGAVACAPSIARAVFMVQREVADRLAAKPGSKTYGALTVFTQAAFDVERRIKVASGAFYPPPRVASAVVVLTPHAEAVAEETPLFRRVVKSAFEARRKTLRNAWSKLGIERDALAGAAETAGVSLDARAETLTVADFARMTDALDALG